MKKFLALMFLCAGLTAMAAPHVNKAELNQANKGQMVMKANTLTNQLATMPSKNFMEGAKKSVMRNNTSLVNQRAPRRLTADDLFDLPYLCFLYKATYDEDGNYVDADPFYAGSGAYWYPGETDPMYFAGFYWDENGSTYYLPLDIDFTTGDVALSWGIALEDDTASDNPGGRTRHDTIVFSALMSEDYYLNQNQNDCMGTIYADGSIIFDDNYVYYYSKIIETYSRGQLTDTEVAAEYAYVYIGTEILVGNGMLNYIRERDNEADSSPVYMYQNATADSLFVGNMWNYGMPNIVLTISPEAKATYDCAEFDPTDSITYLSNPIWDIDNTWISGGLGMCYGVGGYTVDDQGYIDEFLWGFEGDVTPTQITWDYTAASNGYHLFYGYNNNVLTWLNGNTFAIPAAPYTRGDVNNDGQVNITDVTVLIDHLLIQDFDDSENFNSQAADTNEDGSINITDVTKLIDYLLNQSW